MYTQEWAASNSIRIPSRGWSDGATEREVFIREGFVPRLRPLNFHIHFWQRRFPFHTPSMKNGTPFTYLHGGYDTSFLNFSIHWPLKMLNKSTVDSVWDGLKSPFKYLNIMTIFSTLLYKIPTQSYTYSLKKVLPLPRPTLLEKETLMTK